MDINLSWDLFVIVFFAVIIAYSFIIGRDQSLKIIIASYIAILAADGVGNLIEYYLIGPNAVVGKIQVTNTEATMILIKIFIFVATIVLITTRGRFTINMDHPTSSVTGVILNLAYGILSAGLITSTILIYTSGASLVQDGSLVMNQTVMAMYNQSVIVQAMIDNYNIWFSLPAITFVVSSFLGEEIEG